MVTLQLQRAMRQQQAMTKCEAVPLPNISVPTAVQRSLEYPQRLVLSLSGSSNGISYIWLDYGTYLYDMAVVVCMYERLCNQWMVRNRNCGGSERDHIYINIIM